MIYYRNATPDTAIEIKVMGFFMSIMSGQMTFEPKTSFEYVRRCTYAASRSFKNSKSKADLPPSNLMAARFKWHKFQK